jgi:hypothetical protein
MIYINIKNQYGVETIDELDRKDYTTYREYVKALKKLIKDYQDAGMNAYSSQRATSDYRNR